VSSLGALLAVRSRSRPPTANSLVAPLAGSRGTSAGEVRGDRPRGTSAGERPPGNSAGRVYGGTPPGGSRGTSAEETPRGGSTGERRQEGRGERPPRKLRGEGLPGNAARTVAGNVRRRSPGGSSRGDRPRGTSAGKRLRARSAGTVREEDLRGSSAGKGPPGEPVIDARSRLRRDRPISPVAARWTWVRCSASPQLVGLRSGAAPTGLADRATLQLRDPPWRTTARLLGASPTSPPSWRRPNSANRCKRGTFPHYGVRRHGDGEPRPHSRVEHLVVVKGARRVERSRWSGCRRSRHE
jgi:hypothetical protein